MWSFAYKEHKGKQQRKVSLYLQYRFSRNWLSSLHIPLHFLLSSDLFLTSLRYSMEISALIVGCNIGRTINGRNITCLFSSPLYSSVYYTFQPAEKLSYFSGLMRGEEVMFMTKMLAS